MNTRPITRRTLLAAGILLAAAIPAGAIAQGKTTFTVLVASVSNEGAAVDAPLQGMAQDFKRSGLSFTSFKLVGQSPLALALNETQSVTLPNGVAKVTLLKVAGPQATVKVASPGITLELVVSAGGEAYIDAGKHGKGKVYLAVKR